MYIYIYIYNIGVNPTRHGSQHRAIKMPHILASGSDLPQSL